MVELFEHCPLHSLNFEHRQYMYAYHCVQTQLAVRCSWCLTQWGAGVGAAPRIRVKPGAEPGAEPGAGGHEYKELINSYTHTEMFTGLEELLQFENAARVIRNAEGANTAIGPDQWSDAGCRSLAEQAASSFLGPAMRHLEKIESLLV